MPSSVVSSTISAAMLFAGGQTAGAIPPEVVALAEGVLKMMLLKKLTSVAFATVLASLVGLVVTAWVMGQTKTEIEARIENAAALQKNDQGEKKGAKDQRANPAVEKNGLSVSLVAQQQTFIDGEDLRFMATYKNVSDKDFRLHFRPWDLGWEFTIDDDSGSWQVVSLIKGARQPVDIAFKAGHAQGHEVRIADPYFVYRWNGPQTKPVPPREHLKPGKYKLHAVLKFTKNETPGAPFWTGTIKTPPVAFEIVADPIPARLREVEWGKETNGLVAKFRAVKNVVKPGVPMEFELLVKNVSKEEITLGAVNGRLAPYIWRFHFDDWEWSSPSPSFKGRPLKPGDTASVRCLVATTRDSLTDEQKPQFFAGPFRNLKTGEKSTRLPEGVYRVRAAYPGREVVETNVIEVRVSDGGK
jgi:hypothetical protein